MAVGEFTDPIYNLIEYHGNDLEAHKEAVDRFCRWLDGVEIEKLAEDWRGELELDADLQPIDDELMIDPDE
jgi:hypothetical protein